MSEDEAIEILKHVNLVRKFSGIYSTTEIIHEAIETILDLYQEDEEIIKRLNTEYETAQGYILALKKSLEEEKEKNKELEENYDKLTQHFIENHISKDKIREKIEELDNQQRQWLEDRELKNSDEEICFARDFLIKLLKEEE